MKVLSINTRPERRAISAEITVEFLNGRVITCTKWRRGGGWNTTEGIDCSAGLSRDLNQILKEHKEHHETAQQRGA